MWVRILAGLDSCESGVVAIRFKNMSVKAQKRFNSRHKAELDIPGMVFVPFTPFAWPLSSLPVSGHIVEVGYEQTGEDNGRRAAQ